MADTGMILFVILVGAIAAYIYYYSPNDDYVATAPIALMGVMAGFAFAGSFT